MRQVTIIVTEKEHMLLNVHKDLLGADDWEQYIGIIRYAPRTERKILEELGKDLSYAEFGERDDTKRLSFTIEDMEIWNDCRDLRHNWFKSWRAFILEPMYRDNIESFVQEFLSSSSVAMSAGLTTIEEAIEGRKKRWDESFLEG